VPPVRVPPMSSAPAHVSDNTHAPAAHNRGIDTESKQEASIANGAGAPPGQSGASHYDDSVYYPSRHWASCPPCSDGTPEEIAEWLETTTEGLGWIQSQEGLNWLLSSKGQAWLLTPPGAEWPFTQAGESFFTSAWGGKFLQSDAGQTWLQSPPGKRWLREHRPWAASVLRLRNAAIATLFTVCVAGVISVYITPNKDANV